MIVLSLLYFFQQPDQGIEAYAKLGFRESPYAELRGVIRLGEEQARSRNHFRFSRDDAGRIVRVSFQRGEQLRALNHAANHFFHGSVLHIRYEDDREIRHYEDTFGNRVLFWGEVFEEHYFYNRQGERIRLQFLGRDGRPIESDWGIAEYIWRKVGPHSVVEERFNLADEAVDLRPGFSFGRLRLIYHPNGWLDRMQNIDNHGELVENESGAAQDRLEYDELGNIIAWNVLDKHGKPEKGNGPDVARGEMQYNEWGDEIGIVHYDEEGVPMVNAYGFCASSTQFDRFGNMVSRTFLGTDGKPTPHLTAGYQSLIMIWDETGMERRRFFLLGPNGAPFNHQTRGYAEIVRNYNQNRQVTSISFLDRQAYPTIHKRLGVARIQHHYASDGRLQRTEYFDTRGRLVPNLRNGAYVEVFEYDHQGLLEFRHKLAPSE